MKLKNFFKCFATVVACVTLLNASAFALPSLDGQHWDTLTVDERVGNKTNETNITVIRDSSKPLVWYYVPQYPRLAETVTKTKVTNEKTEKEEVKTEIRPVFQLMTLQTKSAKTKDIYEEGLLQFALRMDLQPETASQAKGLIFKKAAAETDKNKKDIEALKLEIETLEKTNTKESLAEAKKKKNEIKQLEELIQVKSLDQIRLLPLPVSSASIEIYKPSGEWLSGGVQQPSIAPIFSTQQVPFQINLTSMGADAMKALTQKGQAGLGVLYILHFEGVLPPANVTVEVDWDQTFSHFSENSRKKEYYFALFSGGMKEENKQKIAESLIENKCIKVTMSGREDELEAMQAVLDPLLERINNELVAKMAPPEAIDPAVAGDPKMCGGMFHGSGGSYAMKDKKVTKRGKEKFTFDRSKIITRSTSCGTFIGIGNYDKHIIEAANIVMDPGNWEKAYYTIPSVGLDPLLVSIDLNQYVQYKKDSGQKEGGLPRFSGCENPQLITWRPDAINGKPGWVDRNGMSVANISWPLQALYAEAKAAGKDINDYVEYKVEMTISAKGKRSTVDEVKLAKLIPMMAGDKPVTNPMALVDTLTVTCDYLTLEKDDGLKKVSFKIIRKDAKTKKKLDTYSWNFSYKDVDNDETYHSWFIPKEGDFQYIPTVKFYPHEKIDGKSYVDWEFNDIDLLDEDEGYGSLEVDPGDEAWDI